MRVLYTEVVPSVGSRIVPHIVNLCVACGHHVADRRVDVSFGRFVVEHVVATAREKRIVLASDSFAAANILTDCLSFSGLNSWLCPASPRYLFVLIKIAYVLGPSVVIYLFTRA